MVIKYLITIVTNAEQQCWLTVLIVARPLRTLDWVVIAVLVILAAIVIYLLQPLIIVIAIIAVGYIIYRWYTGRRLVRTGQPIYFSLLFCQHSFSYHPISVTRSNNSHIISVSLSENPPLVRSNRSEFYYYQHPTPPIAACCITCCLSATDISNQLLAVFPVK